MCMLLLQDKAGLSYKEARAVLLSNWETEKSLMAEFGISTFEAVDNLYRRGMAKVKKTGKNVEEICGDYRLPTCFISPKC